MNRKFWEEEWEKGDSSIASTFYAMLKPPETPGKVLDVGCGDWAYAECFYSKNNFTVGCDIAYNALKKAKHNSSRYKYKVDFVQCDVRYLPFRENSFDNVLAIEMITLTGQYYKNVLEEMYRVTKDDFLFNVTHIESLPREEWNGEIERVAFDENDLKNLIQTLGIGISSFQVLTEYGIESWDFQRALIPFKGRKEYILVTCRK